MGPRFLLIRKSITLFTIFDINIHINKIKPIDKDKFISIISTYTYR